MLFGVLVLHWPVALDARGNRMLVVGEQHGASWRDKRACGVGLRVGLRAAALHAWRRVIRRDGGGVSADALS